MTLDIDAEWQREKDDVINVVADIECPSARIQYAFQAGCLAGRDIIAQVVDERTRLEDRVTYLEHLLSRAYPWLHNPYHETTDIANALEGDAVIEAVQTVIQHVPDESDPLLKLPCASCDGTGKISIMFNDREELSICPNCGPISVTD
jgi:hypothetical protein